MAAIAYAVDGFASSVAVSEDAPNREITVPFSYVTGAALALLITDYISLVKLPKGAVIIDYRIFVPDLDSGTSLTWSLGLKSSGNSAIFIGSTNQVGQGGGVLTPSIQTGITGGSPVAVVGAVADALPSAAIDANDSTPAASLAAGMVHDDELRFTVTASATGAGAGGTMKGWVRYNMTGLYALQN